MSSYSDLKFEIIDVGGADGAWGGITNTNIGTAIEQAITGSADITITSSDVTLTLNNSNGSQTARNLRLNLSGTITGGAKNLILGSGCQIAKLYLVNNGCTDAVTIKNTSGTGIAIPAGKACIVFNNGTNVVDAINYMSSLTLGTDLAVTEGGTGASSASGARTNLGATTLGSNLFTITNPSAITYPQFNADNTVTALDAAAFRTAIGAGSGSGSVTSVSASLPLTSSGGATPNITFASQTANQFLAAPNGTSGTPSFRAILAADVPTLNQNTSGTAASTPLLQTTNFSISEVGGALVFKYGATTIATMDSTGNLTTLNNVTAYGSI